MEITWIKQGDDYTAKVGGYALTIKQVGCNYWYATDDRYLHYAATLEQAKEQAEKAYLEHIKK